MLNNTQKSLFTGLNNNQLKIIAMVSMLIDHIGLVFFPNIRVLRYIGRLAFPIFAYMIAEGCRYTQNRKRYLGMIAGMAIIFQLVFLVFMKSIYQGILVNFSLSIATIFVIESLIKNKKVLNRILAIVFLCAILFIYLYLPYALKEKGFYIDYGIWGLLIPIFVYFAPNKYLRAAFCGLLLIFMSLFSNKVMHWWSLMAIPLFLLYNEKRGSKNLKYLFYIFYPLHLVIIYGIMFLMIILK